MELDAFTMGTSVASAEAFKWKPAHHRPEVSPGNVIYANTQFA